jgi:hypothetical protein
LLLLLLLPGNITDSPPSMVVATLPSVLPRVKEEE